MIRVTGPTDGWSFSDKISLHLQGDGSQLPKKVKFLSLTDPESGSLVS